MVVGDLEQRQNSAESLRLYPRVASDEQQAGGEDKSV